VGVVGSPYRDKVVSHAVRFSCAALGGITREITKTNF
jgi:hypothetical protein